MPLKLRHACLLWLLILTISGCTDPDADKRKALADSKNSFNKKTTEQWLADLQKRSDKDFGDFSKPLKEQRPDSEVLVPVFARLLSDSKLSLDKTLGSLTQLQELGPGSPFEAEAIEALLARLKGNNSFVIQQSCASLRAFGPKASKALPRLFALVEDSSSKSKTRVALIRKAVGSCIQELAAGEGSSALLLEKYQSDKAELRQLAVRGMSHAKTLDTVIKALDDKDPMVTDEAIQALGRFPGQGSKVLPVLKPKLGQRGGARALAIQSLAAYGDELAADLAALVTDAQSTPLLRQSATEVFEAMPKVAPEKIGQVSQKQASDLLVKAPAALKVRVAKAVVGLHKESVDGIRALLPFLASNQTAIPATLGINEVLRGSPKLRVELRAQILSVYAVLPTDHPTLRGAIEWAFLATQERETFGKQVQSYVDDLSNSNKHKAYVAARCLFWLVRMSHPKAAYKHWPPTLQKHIGAMIGALSSKNDRVVRTLIRTLGCFGPIVREASPQLESLHGQFPKEVEAALKKIQR